MRLRLNWTTRNHIEPKSGADAWTKYSMNVRSDDEYKICYKENKDNILAGTKRIPTWKLRDFKIYNSHFNIINIHRYPL